MEQPDHLPQRDERHPLDRWLTLPAVLLLIIVGATFYEVLCRYILTRPTIWANELSLMLSSIVFIAAGVYVMRRDEHLRISVLYDLSLPRLRRIFDTTTLACTLIFCGTTIWFGGPTAWSALLRWERYGTAWNPPIPAIIQPLIVVAAGAMAVFAVLNFLRAWRRNDPARLAGCHDADAASAKTTAEGKVILK